MNLSSSTARMLFSQLTEKALPMIDYKLDSLKQNINLGSEEGKIDFMKKAAEVLKTLSPG